MNSERRRRRYQEWTEFFQNAGHWFSGVAETEPRFVEFQSNYSFYALKGGRDGGQDLHRVDVFFGIRVTDRNTYIRVGDSGMPRVGQRIIVETGASLQYRRLLSGLVACYLAPAWSDDDASLGEMYLLGRYEPARLTPNDTLLYTHFAQLMAYFECTSIDGAPTIRDRLLTAYLKLTKVRWVDRALAPRRIMVGAKRIVGFALTVGLSGFVLLILQHFFK